MSEYVAKFKSQSIEIYVFVVVNQCICLIVRSIRCFCNGLFRIAIILLASLVLSLSSLSNFIAGCSSRYTGVIAGMIDRIVEPVFLS